MITKQQIMSPQDIIILLKICSLGQNNWQQSDLASELAISQSEISKSLRRSKQAGLLDPTGKIVMKLGLLDFLKYGLRYVFPQKPGAIVRGVPTSHSAEPLKSLIDSNEQYVWPYAKGTIKGQSIIPLFPSVPEAALKDTKFHEILALVDALRIGRAREKELAIIELEKRLNNGE